MEKKGIRGVSPVVGTILLIAITVALAAVVATLVSGLGGRGTPPSAMLTVTAEISGNNITLTISHEGGDDLVLKDLEIKASNDNVGGMETIKGTDLTGIAGTTFNVGESGKVTYTSTGIVSGDTITVFIIHTPTKQKLFSSSSVVVR
jgi:flagellin-like protein